LVVMGSPPLARSAPGGRSAPGPTARRASFHCSGGPRCGPGAGTGQTLFRASGKRGPEEGNGLPGARAGLSMPDRANRFPDRCWRAGPGRAADRAARTAGGGPRACVGGVNVWLTGHQIRSKLACPRRNPQVSSKRLHIHCSVRYRRHCRPARFGAITAGVRALFTVFGCPVGGRQASPRKSQTKSQRRPTSGDTQRRQATVGPGQVPTERH